MKRTLHIARNEIHSLYYSPLAWVFMVIMMLLTAGSYISTFEAHLKYWQTGGYSLLPRGSGAFTGVMTGYFSVGVIENLYLYFPLITMAVFSREIGSGTIKLLYSSPIRIREIVLGKFLGLLVVLLVYLVIVLLPVIAYCMVLNDPDYGQVVASYAGFFLLLCAIAAIGLFISSLSSYQIVAAIITFVVLTFFKRAGWYWQEVDWFRNVSYYLDFTRKAEKLFRGLITLADVIYFLVIIIGFLCFTIFRLKGLVSRSAPIVKAGRYFAVMAAGTGIMIFVSNPFVNKYADTTRDDLHTITKNMQQWLAKLDQGPLEITIFANVLDDRLDGFGFTPATSHRGVYEPFQQIIRFKPDTRVKLVNYYDIDSGNAIFKEHRGLTLKQIAQRRADAFSMDFDDVLTPEEVRKLADVKKEEYRNFFQYKYKGRIATSRPFDDTDPLYKHSFPNDEHYAAVFSKLLDIPTPTVLFITDEIERGPYSNQLRDYKHFTRNPGFNRALGNRGFIVDTLSLAKQDIPEGIAALVIADPRTAFSAGNLEKIRHYIAGGGNLLVTGEADRKEILKPVLDELGIRFRPGILIQPSEKYASNRIYNNLTDTAQHIAPQFERITNDKRETLGDTTFPVIMDGAASLEPVPVNGFSYFPLTFTNPSTSWNRIAPIMEDSLQAKVPRREDDESGSFVTAYLLKRKINGKEQRIVVAGDADFLTRPLASWRLNALNFDFNLGIFNYFTYGQFPANVTWPRATDNGYTIKVEDLYIQEIIFYYLIPALFVIAGSVILIRRKRK